LNGVIERIVLVYDPLRLAVIVIGM